MQNTKHAIFMLGQEEYGLDIMEVSIIEKVTPIEQAAGLPKNFKGVIKLRGEVIPVYSLRSKFNMNDIPADDETRFVITIVKGIPVAVEVDRVVEITLIESDMLYSVPSIVSSSDTSYIRNITKLGDRLVILLDHDGILSEDEFTKVQTVINKKQ